MRMSPAVKLLTSVALFALLSASCTDQSSTISRTQILSTVDQVMTLCCDEDGTFPVKVGEIQIQIFEGQLNFIDQSTRSNTFAVTVATATDPGPGEHQRAAPISFSVPDGGALEEGATTVEVFAESCGFDVADIDFVAEVVGRRLDDRTTAVVRTTGSFQIVNTCAGVIRAPSPPQVLLEAVIGQELDTDTFDALQREDRVGEATFAPPVLASSQPPQPFLEIFATGAAVVPISQDALDIAFNNPDALLRPGETTELGFTVPLFATPVNAGNFLVMWLCVQEDVLLDDIRSLRLGSSPIGVQQIWFLLETDGDPANNFSAPAGQENSFQVNTDFRVLGQLTDINPNGSSTWSLIGNRAVRMVIQGPVVMAFIPLDIFAMALPPVIQSRFVIHVSNLPSSFDVWSGDQTPAINPMDRTMEELIPISLEPSFPNLGG